MQRISQIIEEIKDLKKEATHRSALRISGLLENNKKLFLEKIDADAFNHLLSGFEDIANTSPKEQNTEAYRENYQKNHDSLSFYLNRII